MRGFTRENTWRWQSALQWNSRVSGWGHTSSPPFFCLLVATDQLITGLTVQFQITNLGNENAFDSKDFWYYEYPKKFKYKCYILNRKEFFRNKSKKLLINSRFHIWNQNNVHFSWHAWLIKSLDRKFVPIYGTNIRESYPLWIETPIKC